MKIDFDKIGEQIDTIESILSQIAEDEKKYRHFIDCASEEYRKSAKNLIHYHSLRSHDLRQLQKQLRYLGLSRLANSGGHVRASLLHVRFFLKSLIKQQVQVPVQSGLSIKNGRKLLTNHTKDLLGKPEQKRRVRIMVTQPKESAYNYEMVRDMVKKGMNCARINCAHDDASTWLKIIKNVKKAAREMGKEVKVTMDLAGPKNRTGALPPGPKVKKFTPSRDPLGKVISAAKIRLVPNGDERAHQRDALSVSGDWLIGQAVGDVIHLEDTRGKQRKWTVVEKETSSVVVESFDTSYVQPGTRLQAEKDTSNYTSVGDMPAQERYILLKADDILIVRKNKTPGRRQNTVTRATSFRRQRYPVRCQKFLGLFGSVKKYFLMMVKLKGWSQPEVMIPSNCK